MEAKSQIGTAWRRWFILLAAVVVANVADLLIAAVAHAAGASDDFKPLQPSAFVFLGTIAMAIGTVGWALVRRTHNGARALRWLVPTVLAISLVPDIAVGISGSQGGTSWTAVLGLMAMHLAVAGALVASLRHVLPLGVDEPAVMAARTSV